MALALSHSFVLPAKLFAAVTVLFAILAGLARLRPLPGLDVGIHSTYFVIGPARVLLFCTLMSANFAVLYYAVSRLVHGRWNRTLSVLHFSLFLSFAVSLSVLLVVFSISSESEQAIRWAVVAWLLGVLSFVSSLLVFAINLTLTVVQQVRARFARQ